MRDTVVSVWRAPYLVVAIVLLAGCGGSSGNRLTKEGYAAKADAVQAAKAKDLAVGQAVRVGMETA